MAGGMGDLSLTSAENPLRQPGEARGFSHGMEDTGLEVGQETDREGGGAAELRAEGALELNLERGTFARGTVEERGGENGEDASTVDPCFVIQLIRTLLPGSREASGNVSGQETSANLPGQESSATLPGRESGQESSQEAVQDAEQGPGQGPEQKSGRKHEEACEEEAYTEPEGGPRHEDSEAGPASEAEAEDRRVEEAGCVLWDLSMSQDHASLMVKNHIISVLLAVLGSSTVSSRRKELCLGILANLACHRSAARALISTSGSLRTALAQLFIDDPPCLTEASRLLRSCLQSKEGAVRWGPAVVDPDMLQRILWVASNTLHHPLLAQSLLLLLAILEAPSLWEDEEEPSAVSAGPSRQGLEEGTWVAGTAQGHEPAGTEQAESEEGRSVQAGSQQAEAEHAASEKGTAGTSGSASAARAALCGAPRLLLAGGLLGLLRDAVLAKRQQDQHADGGHGAQHEQTASVRTTALEVAELVSLEEQVALERPQRLELLSLALGVLVGAKGLGSKCNDQEEEEEEDEGECDPLETLHRAKAVVVAANLLSSDRALVEEVLPASGPLVTSLLGVISGTPEDDPARPASWALLRALFSGLSSTLPTRPREAQSIQGGAQETEAVVSISEAQSVQGGAQETEGVVDRGGMGRPQWAETSAPDWAAKAAQSLASHMEELLDVLGEEEGGGGMDEEPRDEDKHRCTAIHAMVRFLEILLEEGSPVLNWPSELSRKVIQLLRFLRQKLQQG